MEEQLQASSGLFVETAHEEEDQLTGDDHDFVQGCQLRSYAAHFLEGSVDLPKFAWLWGQRHGVLVEKAKHVLETKVDLSAVCRRVLRCLEGSPNFGVDEADKVSSTNSNRIVETISGVVLLEVQGSLVVEEVPRWCLANAPADCCHQLRESVEVDY